MSAEPSNPAPGRTLDQRMGALRHANEIRIGRARLKRELASGRVRLEDIIAAPPEFARTAKVYDLLLALPKVGPAKAARSLSQCQVAPSKTVAGLTDRQRHELIGLFRRWRGARHQARSAPRFSSTGARELPRRFFVDNPVEDLRRCQGRSKTDLEGAGNAIRLSSRGGLVFMDESCEYVSAANTVENDGRRL